MAQAKMVKGLIETHRPEVTIEILVIKTSGDLFLDRALADIGGKGLFTKEIEEALLDRRIDLAVHSMKDMPTRLPEGLILAAMPKREDVRDVLVGRNGETTLDELPTNARIGSASLRRQAQLRRYRPDLQVDILRGNVQTRLRKLEEGAFDATILARAGLNRLGLSGTVGHPIPCELMLPAVAQGAVGIETRADDVATLEILAPLKDTATEIAVICERALLAELDGSCRTPIAAWARLLNEGQDIHLVGQVLSPDGKDFWELEKFGPTSQAHEIGTDVGRDLLGLAGDMLAKLRPHG